MRYKMSDTFAVFLQTMVYIALVFKETPVNNVCPLQILILNVTVSVKDASLL